MEIVKVADPMEHQVQGFKELIQSLNIAWFEIASSKDVVQEVIVALEDIDCMTIERHFKMYIESKGDAEYRVVILGAYSVDLKLKIKFLTDEPGNIRFFTVVIRGNSH